MLFAVVCAAGALGALARWGVDLALRRRFPAARLPWATLLVNTTGSALLGLLAGAALPGGPLAGAGVGEALHAVLGTGFCGGYTTFSTASVEVLRLGREHTTRTAAGYAAATLLLTAGAAAAGIGAGAAL
ncbi:fluoride efflux transporter FluC [Kineococcus glutinatus]|uniref:fluoride efflux transporter FluC n=1 Tax=Kineococcus glutinatus TaxID=1070872 RepID=UPI003CD0A0C7